MKDINEQIGSGQNSRAKLKQRLAGGAVLLIVLAICLPFIFNHSHQNMNTGPVDQTQPAANSAANSVQPAEQPAQAPQAAAEQSVATPAVTAPEPAAQTATYSTEVSAGEPAPAQPAEQPQAVAPATSDQATVAAPAPDSSLRSDQPGVTPVQSESAQPAEPAESAAPPQRQLVAPVTQSAQEPVELTQPTQPAAPAQAVPEQEVNAPAAHALPPPVKNAAKAAPQQGRWSVQVGSFSQPEYAQQLASKLRARGYLVYTQRENQFTRVYVGPIANQYQAQKIQQKVNDQFQIAGLVREARN
jgi:DedD protein